MVDPANIAVAVPAVAEIEALKLLEILLGQAPVEIGADAVERDVDEDAEEFPVVIGSNVEFALFLSFSCHANSARVSLTLV